MTRLQKFQKRIEALADAALISSPQNQRYLSEFSFEDGYLLVFADEAFLLTDGRYIEAAEKAAPEGFTVLAPREGRMETVSRLLAKRGAKTLAFEESHLSVRLKERFAEAVLPATLVGGVSKELCELRICKDEKELQNIKKAQEITDAAFSHILSVLTPTMREIDVALELEFFMRRMGSEGVAFDTIAVSGSASALPHGVPRNMPLEKGFLTMDFGARVGGYCADMTRTVAIGSADVEMKKLYQTVLRTQEAALARAAAGVSCAALDRVAREVIDSNGYEGCFLHSLGHGVGLDIHEAPSLSRAAGEAVLQPGMVVTVEPGIYLGGRYGCRIEDMIAVCADGVLNFTKSSKDLIEIG